MVDGENQRLTAEEIEDTKLSLQELTQFVKLAFDQSHSYNNVIILAGYGGIFSLIVVTREFLPQYVLLISVILVAISLLVFVAYIIFNMYIMSVSNIRMMRDRLIEIRDLNEQTGFDVVPAEKAISTLRGQERLWLWVLSVTVSFGFASGVLLLFWYGKALIFGVD